LLGCISLYLTQSKGTTEGSESDEIPLSRTLASKSKGKARPVQHRKTTQPQDDSDTHDDDLSLVDAMPSKGKRGIGAPTVTGARPSKPIRGNKRRRLTSPAGEKDDTVKSTVVSKGLPTHRV
jgi:hypothetical protein